MHQLANIGQALPGREILSASMPAGVQEFLNGVLAVAILGAVAAAFGILMRMLMRGSNATFNSCLAVAAAGGLVCGLYGKELGLSFFGAAAGLTLALSAVCRYSARYQEVFEVRVEMAPAVANYLLGHFDELDSDGDGLVKKVDLMVALNRGSFYEEDMLLLTLALRDIEFIGHVVDASHVSMPAMYGGGGAVVAHYGISRQDLVTYPERIEKRFIEEFGE
ncbi:MAG TPA: hypothetical protein V6D08_11515 [Candidatus Obscuribacterales bacterium]